LQATKLCSAEEPGRWVCSRT